MIASTMFGLESILEYELIKIGARNIKKGNRCVYFYGNKKTMYTANLRLRTALKILKPISEFKAKKEDDLYYQISKINWLNILSLNKSFSVTSTINSKYFTHSNYVSLLTKDAIVDQFNKKIKKRPSVDVKNPDINIYVHIADSRCTISLNSSGGSLHKRGYRSEKFAAPLNEVLAAGIIMLSNWNNKKHFINPMCGSGTMLIEGALIAINRAPNIYRKNFNFQNWKNYDSNLFKEIKKELTKNEKSSNTILHGYDVSASAISIAEKHVKNMNLENIIKVHGSDFFNTECLNNNSIVFINPPYGKRLNLQKDYYKEIGNTLKKYYNTSHAWIISSEMSEIKKIGLKPSKKIKLYNGSLECKLLQYELYKGSRKFSKNLDTQVKM